MIYLASGFFCERELNMIRSLESALDVLEVKYFSPRLGDDNDLPMEEKMKPHNAQKIFEMDCRHMDQCEGMIAYLGGPRYYNYEKDKLSQALDTGVVFEMGYMSAQGKPIIGFGDEGVPMNLMLARCLAGKYFSWEQLYARMFSWAESDLLDWLSNGIKAEASE